MLLNIIFGRKKIKLLLKSDFIFVILSLFSNKKVNNKEASDELELPVQSSNSTSSNSTDNYDNSVNSKTSNSDSENINSKLESVSSV